jgi:hypothetical protein
LWTSKVRARGTGNDRSGTRRCIEATDIAEQLLQDGDLLAGGRSGSVDRLHLARIVRAIDLHILHHAAGIEVNGHNLLLQDFRLKKRRVFLSSGRCSTKYDR